MTVKERAAYYYGAQKKHCPESMLLAANDVYGLEVTEREESMLLAFAGGLYSGSTCGALLGSLAVLGRMYSGRPDFKDICSKFVSDFRARLGCDSLDCAVINPKYKTPEGRCVKTVEIAGDLLEETIDGLEGRVKEPQGCTLSPEDIKRVKGMGFLQHKGTNKFNGRIITRNGRITTEESQVITEAAKLYGDGHIMLTTRLTIEVSGIDYKDIEAFQAYIAKAGLETGGTGSKVRPVVSCKGTTCQYGLYDTYALSQELHERFYKGYRQVTLPHKFKIAVGGCPNNCVKPDLNDLGIIGAKVPGYDPAGCKGCKVCQVEQTCPIHAAKLVDGKLVIDREKCNNCGRCVAKCPFHCNDDSVSGWRIYVGGRWGKQVHRGQMLDKVFTDRQELFDTVEKAILLFRSEGIPGERFADTIARLGFDKVQEMLLGNELLEKKAEILGLDVVGGATC